MAGNDNKNNNKIIIICKDCNRATDPGDGAEHFDFFAGGDEGVTARGCSL